MTEMILNQEKGEDPLQVTKAFVAEWMNCLARMMSVMMYAVFYLFVGCNMYVSNHMSVGMLTSFFGKNTKYSSFGHRFPAFFFESDVI